MKVVACPCDVMRGPPGVMPPEESQPATQAARLGRLGEVHVRADRLQFLHDEPPAGRGLQRDLEVLAGEPAQEPTDAVTVRRRHPGAADFTRLGVQPIGRDLRSMLVESHYDRHPGPPHAPRLKYPARHARLS